MAATTIDTVQGTLEFLVLKTLSRRALYGYAIARWVFDKSGHQLELKEGTLYPALSRMEERGWLSSDWRISQKNRKVKYYTLTDSGRAELMNRQERWQDFTATVNRVLESS